MNILIPDSWLREFLETDATPEQIKEYISLCGPTIERVHKKDGELIYDVEVTTNRPDCMSVFGVAREAAAILPRFGIGAKLINNPYQKKNGDWSTSSALSKPLNIQTDPKLNPRWVSIVIDNVTVKSSPTWLTQKLESTGIRSLNTIVDITNYLMRAYGQPAHAFDYDEIKPNSEGIPTMSLRASKNGEKVTTLDGKTHALTGGDIVIEDGSKRLIDLAGIMGAQNSSIKASTKTIVLFMQTYDPVQIRKTSMALAHRTEAATLFEKGLDEELVLPTVLEGIKMVQELAGGEIAGPLTDLYPKPFQAYQVSVKRNKVDAYLGKKLKDDEIKEILTSLGFDVEIVGVHVSVLVPSYRRDIQLDVDIIEEIARLYGYHHIKSTLPDTPPPFSQPDRSLQWEEEIKMRLRDWGYTETYTYSMISEELMDIFKLDKAKAYKIANPLSSEWTYMRPILMPSLLQVIKENLNFQNEVSFFELSMQYKYAENDLPEEQPVLVIARSGEHFYEIKGIVESIGNLFGLQIPIEALSEKHYMFDTTRSISLGTYGMLGKVSATLLQQMGIKQPVTFAVLRVSELIKNNRGNKQYVPIPKFPKVIEDMTFILPARTAIGSIMNSIRSVSKYVVSVQLVSQYQNTSSFRINYLKKNEQITDDEVVAVRLKIKETVEIKFDAKLKG